MLTTQNSFRGRKKKWSKLSGIIASSLTHHGKLFFEIVSSAGLSRLRGSNDASQHQ